jgi:hypothetical protein
MDPIRLLSRETLQACGHVEVYIRAHARTKQVERPWPRMLVTDAHVLRIPKRGGANQQAAQCYQMGVNLEPTGQSDTFSCRIPSPSISRPPWERTDGT